MMTVSEFRKRTFLFLHRRKSPFIKDIDKLLKEYYKTNSDNRKMKCLVYLYMMCKHYLHTKPDGKRSDGIYQLMQSVAQELNSEDFKKKLAAKAGGVHYSGGYKQDLMKLSNPMAATSVGTSHYHEAVLPQKNFVQKMQLNMEELIGDSKYFGASDLEIDFGKTYNLTTHTMTQILDKLHELWTSKEAVRKFNYLNSEQRIEKLLIVKNGKLYNYHNQQPHMGADFIDRAGLPFAMDLDERLYAHSGNILDWNHSSFTAGKPVIAAGCIWVDNGKLLMISNESGHYKPNKYELAACVKVLVNQGIDPNSFKVLVFGDKTYDTATQFLASVQYF
jgi:hypothetical protein